MFSLGTTKEELHMLTHTPTVPCMHRPRSYGGICNACIEGPFAQHLELLLRRLLLKRPHALVVIVSHFSLFTSGALFLLNPARICTTSTGI